MSEISKVKKGLRFIGLTELEVMVYLKLLELKQAKVSKLARATKVTRTQLYPLLEKLVEKGVLKKIDKEPVIEYRVLEPSELINLLEKWKKETIKTLKDLEFKLKKLKKK